MRWISVVSVLLCWSVVAWLTLTPSPPQLADSEGWLLAPDKLAHAGVWAVLALASWWMLRSVVAWTRWRRAAVVWLACVGYGAFIEWGQSLSAARSSDIMDFWADVVGSTMAVLLMLGWEKWRERGTSEQEHRTERRPPGH